MCLFSKDFFRYCGLAILSYCPPCLIVDLVCNTWFSGVIIIDLSLNIIICVTHVVIYQKKRKWTVGHQNTFSAWWLNKFCNKEDNELVLQIPAYFYTCHAIRIWTHPWSVWHSSHNTCILIGDEIIFVPMFNFSDWCRSVPDRICDNYTVDWCLKPHKRSNGSWLQVFVYTLIASTN